MAVKLAAILVTVVYVVVYVAAFGVLPLLLSGVR